mmetsp:Transcript_15617/g.23777  ORF Transcript_15617/g.23777 Transcript_15617/m.23777 type:complete len:201 (-) Transcript_15617:116-718(-)
MNAMNTNVTEERAQEAMALLDRMEHSYSMGYNTSKPNDKAYIAAINVWSRSLASDKASKAFDILGRMTELYLHGDESVKPNVIALNSVLRACAYTRGTANVRERAVYVANEVMHQFAELNEKPDHITYVSLFRVYGQLVKNKDRVYQLFRSTLDRCCKEGQLHPHVLDIVKRFAPKNYAELPSGKDGRVVIPKEWSANAK